MQKNGRKKDFVIAILLILLLGLIFSDILEKADPRSFVRGQTPFSQRFLCPTPEPGKKTLQLVPCYVDKPLYLSNPDLSPDGKSIVLFPSPSLAPGQMFCAPDSVRRNNCQCLPHQGASLVCRDDLCLQHNGSPFAGLVRPIPGTTLGQIEVPEGVNCFFPPGFPTPANAACAEICL